ncbi:MAG TPA: hypothetical protein VF246_09850 [Acidimicrobiia bacterium]
MIHLSRLLVQERDRICFDARGDARDDDLPPGRAVMLVSGVTDALKTVRDGEVVDAVDRESVAHVVAFAVDRSLLETLGDDSLTAEELVEAVLRQGVDWVLVSQDEFFRPLRAQ